MDDLFIKQGSTPCGARPDGLCSTSVDRQARIRGPRDASLTRWRRLRAQARPPALTPSHRRRRSLASAWQFDRPGIRRIRTLMSRVPDQTGSEQAESAPSQARPLPPRPTRPASGLRKFFRETWPQINPRCMPCRCRRRHRPPRADCKPGLKPGQVPACCQGCSPTKPDRGQEV